MDGYQGGGRPESIVRVSRLPTPEPQFPTPSPRPPTLDPRPPTPNPQPPTPGPRPVPWIAALEPAVHGSFDESAAAKLHARGPQLPPRYRHVLDFSVNGNVIGPPPGVAAAIAQADISRYPDRDATALRAAIAQRHSVPASWVVVGNGSTELIWAIARAYLAPGDAALVVSPTYGEYAVASAAAGARLHCARVLSPAGRQARRPRSAARDAELIPALARSIESVRPQVVWLCHPNNPTGAALPLRHLHDLMDVAPRALFVVDEAYLPLCDGLPSALPLVAGGQALVLRSMTKDAGLAGLRVGYAIAPPAVADVVRRAIPPWSVSSVAQAAALATLADAEHGARARAAVATSRAHLVVGLQRLGLRPYPSVANFVLVPVGDAPSVARALLDRGCAVRDCTSFGLPDCIRIGVRPVPDQERLLAALAEVPGLGSRVPTSGTRNAKLETGNCHG